MRLVQLAPLAGYVREEIEAPLGKALKNAGINERHIRRLLAASRDDINDQLRKMVRLLGGKVNVADLIATSVFWGEKTIRRVAMDYFSPEKEEEAPTA